MVKYYCYHFRFVNCVRIIIIKLHESFQGQIWWLWLLHRLSWRTSKALWPLTWIACVAWRFWLGALSNKGGLGQRNCEEIGVGATYFSRGFAARSRALCARISRLRRSCARLHKTAMLRRLWREQRQTVLPLPSYYARFKATLSHLPWKSRQAWYNSATVLANKE